MTIPTLVANYQEKSWGTAASVFDRKLNEALKTMNTQQTLAGYTTTEDFVSELSKHIKILKTCDNTKLTDCFSDTVYWGGGTATPEEVDMSVIKTAKNFGQKDWGTNIVGVQFANGTNALIAYNPITHSDDSTVKVCKQDPFSNTVGVGDCLAILYDTSGYKSPNTSGKDLRSNEHVKSLGSGCAFEIGSTCYTTLAFVPTPMTYEECAGENATSAETNTIAGTYAQSLGIKSCYWSNDYWAGAVKACGGVDKMPTMTQLRELANYLYNTSGLTDYSESGLSLDLDKRNSVGIPVTSFAIWSGSEYEQKKYTHAYYRSFDKYSTAAISHQNPSGKSSGGNRAICLEN